MNEFKEALEKIGDLYEEGKDCLNFLPFMSFEPQEDLKFQRLFEILKELRDISALAYKKINKIGEN